VRAANSRDPEQNAWSRVQLGNLYFNSGHYREAKFQFQRATDFLPEYASAYTGLAKVQTAEQQFEMAILSFQKSIAIVPTYDAVVGLGDLYLCEGQEAKAAKTFELLSVIEQHDRSHNIQPESYMALFYADHDVKMKEALEIVEKQAARRKDIRTWDALAWTLYKSGRYLEARAASKQAMRLGTRDALLYYHSGMIEERLGDFNRATGALEEALRINPDFHPLHAGRARIEIKEMTARATLSHAKPSREG
jgi:tetratricopeptide (TPR) repeat protein